MQSKDKSRRRHRSFGWCSITGRQRKTYVRALRYRRAERTKASPEKVIPSKSRTYQLWTGKVAGGANDGSQSEMVCMSGSRLLLGPDPRRVGSRWLPSNTMW